MDALPVDPVTMQWRRNMILAILLMRRRRTRYTRKRWWVRPIFQERRRQGDYQNLLQEMRLTDEESHFNYMRMSADMFDVLLGLIGPVITKASLSRDVVSPGERLCITLRYLAAGDSMGSLSFQYRIGRTTVSNIIKETSEAIWETLKDQVFMSPTTENWRKVSASFWQKWNFPNCIGAVDGKHIVMQAPANSGSEFYNYKGSHSIVLLAACDANYIFTLVDIGAAGRQSDGGVFKNSVFGRLQEEEKLNIPQPSVLLGSGSVVPYVFVGDEAFPLKKYLLRPYPGNNLNRQRRIFNYRLSRAWRVIENAFGIMAARFRLLRRPILAKVENIEKVVRAIVCLHNWIIQNEGARNRMYCPPGYPDHEDGFGNAVAGRWRREGDENGCLRAIGRVGSNNSRRDLMNMRDVFSTYFMEPGQVPWQWDI